MVDEFAAQDPAVQERITLQLGRMTFDPRVIIYSTIILLSTYAIYDEGREPLMDGPWLNIAIISIAPLFAIAMAHAFSEALDMQIRYRRALTAHDRRHVLLQNLQYLIVAIPPVFVMGVLIALNIRANTAINVILWLGTISLVLWGFYAGRRAGLAVSRQILFGIFYGLTGIVIVLVEMALTH